jgi:hypothetical protein
MDRLLGPYNNAGRPTKSNSAQRGMEMEPTDETVTQADAGLGPIGQFAVKTVIVAGAIVVAAWIMLDLLDDFADRRMQQFEQTLRSATSLGGRQFWTKLEGQLDQLADPRSDISPEKKQKILTQIKVISDRWRPFVTEVAASFEGEPNKQPK